MSITIDAESVSELITTQSPAIEYFQIGDHQYQWSWSLFDSCVEAAINVIAEEGKTWADVSESIREITMSTTKSPLARSGKGEVMLFMPAVTTHAPGKILSWPFVNMYAGLSALVGPTGGGKSYMGTVTLAPDVVIRYGERSEHVDTLASDQPTVSATSFSHALILALVLSVLGLKVTLDSMRFPVYRMPGSTGEKGTKPELYLLLTDISNLCAKLCVSPVVIVNPMVRDDALDKVMLDITSSVAAVALVKNRTIASGTYVGADGRPTTIEHAGESVDEPKSPFSVNNVSTDVSKVIIDSDYVSQPFSQDGTSFVPERDETESTTKISFNL